jgi:glycosyltransferase involved in cell wall biosynthesis
MRVGTVIPALDEEATVRAVVERVLPFVHEVVVVDNGSRDRTPEEAEAGGARVVREPRRGYGRACLTGIAALGPVDAILFLDADLADVPEEAPAVLEPIRDGRADLVIGSRVLGRAERGALLPQARFGNALATFLMRILFAARATDLGPFRAVRADAYRRLGMRDETWGWTVEMQVRAARLGFRTVEVPVSYRKRVGRSKITGTLKGAVKAGWKILATIFRHALAPPPITRGGTNPRRGAPGTDSPRSPARACGSGPSRR